MHDSFFSRRLAFAQLLRLPNVFTAFADIAMTACVGVAARPALPPGSYWLSMILIALASGSLYLAGMVWNDIFDLVEDTRARPFRPLPSGRITRRTAILLATVLLVLGLVLAALAGMPGATAWNSKPFLLALGIAALVLLYDAWLKRTALGPVAMASCRFVNVLFGLTVIPVELLPDGLRYHLASVVGVYIVGVTWFARTEEGESRSRWLFAAASVIGLALGLAFLLRWRVATVATGQFLFPYLLVAFGFHIGTPIARAIRTPGPREVQAAVKRSVLGLIALDTVLAVAFIGAGGLLVLLLLPPALWLGKWVYST